MDSAKKATSAPTQTSLVVCPQDKVNQGGAQVVDSFPQEAVCTRWALKNFEDWAAPYNLRHPDSPCPAGILLD